ncbi:MAG TPA: GntR family transcriptional regulator [Gaiellaceae bacterium]|nr:GntR family transcriptional regulator [Gaiellaceae bacterium]
MAKTAPVQRPKRRSSRSEQVLQILRHAIVVGELVDGERLIEDRIARQLNTSRGPVREALRRLEHEGLVVSYPYRGAVVRGVSDEEVHEVLIPIRLTLERFSFTKALEFMTEADFGELAKEVWQMGEGARTGDLLRCVEADIRFHEFVLSRSGQPHTAQVWGSIESRIRAYFFRFGLEADMSRLAAEHSELLAALQSGDREVLMDAVERHITVRTPGPVG